MSRFTLVPVVLALLVACAAPEPPSPAPTRGEQELDILEAVFRHQFENNASAAQQKADAYFLAIRDADPAPEFLARFVGHIPPVKAGSAFQTGQGVKFRVDTIEWLTDDKVKVSGGYYEASLSASGNDYVVERDGDGWTVTDDTMNWIS